MRTLSMLLVLIGFGWEAPLPAAAEKPVFTLAHKQGFSAVAFSPDSKLLAAGGCDGISGTVRIWNLRTRRFERRLIGHITCVMCMAFSPDGKRIVAGDRGGETVVWDVASGRVLVHIQDVTQLQVAAVAFSPDGKQFVTLSRTPTMSRITWWDSGTGKPVKVLNGGPAMEYRAAFSPKGDQLVSGGRSHLELWNTAKGKNRVVKVPALKNTVNSIAFTRDGKQIALGHHAEIVLVAAATGKQTRKIPVSKLHARFLTGLAFGPRGRVLAAGACNRRGKPSRVTLWDTGTGRRLHTFRGHLDNVRCAAISPDGRWLATGAASRNLKLWDVRRFTRVPPRTDRQRKR